jgi:D-xylose transport system ATP-binding protein
VITHSILHAFQVADRIVVLRHGKVAGERRTAATTHEEIVSLVTDDLRDPVPPAPSDRSDPP